MRFRAICEQNSLVGYAYVENPSERAGWLLLQFTLRTSLRTVLRGTLWGPLRSSLGISQFLSDNCQFLLVLERKFFLSIYFVNGDWRSSLLGLWLRVST